MRGGRPQPRHSRSTVTLPRRRRLTTGVAAVALALTAVAGLTIEASASDGSPKVVAYDAMKRTVASGLGSADLGGAWTTSNAAKTSVSNGQANLANITPGGSLSAGLPSVTATDTGIEAVVVPQYGWAVGSGFYVDLALRKQGNGDTYYAKVRFLTSGRVAVSVSRVTDRAETFLSTETIVPIVAGTVPLTIQAQAIGGSAVTLGIRVWSDGQARPTGWQATSVDRNPGSVAGAGSIGLYTYLSRSATAPAGIGVSRLTVWDGGIGDPYAPSGSSSTSASSTPTTSTPAAPTSSAASSTTASTTSAPATTSSVPTSPTSSTTTAAPPVVVPSSGSAGSAPLGSTKYTVPSGALIVSPSGNDSAAGTTGAPLRSVGAAIQRASSGATIVLRAGTYNESVTIPSNKSLTVQSYPGEVVWLDGTTAVGGWTQRGSVWVHDGWTPQFDSIPSQDPNNIPSGTNWGFVNPSFPMAAHPDELWLDNTELTQVGSAGEVSAGMFFVDYTNHQLVSGTNPAGHAASATNLAVALTSYAPNTTVRGIGVRRYATSVDLMGTVRMMGTGARVENVVITDSASTGLIAGAGNATLHDLTVLNSGLLGVLASQSDNLVVDGLFAQNNNDEHFNAAPTAGGIKIGKSRGVVIANSVLNANLGTGVWFDVSVYNATVVHTSMTNNASHGLSFEISSTGILADNVVTGNSGDGFKINDSDKVQVWNNRITSNGRNVEIVQDARRGSNPNDYGHDNRQKQPDPTEPWIIFNVSLMNNIIGTSGSYPVYVNDYSGQYTPAQLNITVNGNQFTHSGQTLIQWASSGFVSPSAFTAATGQGQANSEIGTGAVTPAAAVAEPALPADVAAAVGQPAGTRHLGPFS